MAFNVLNKNAAFKTGFCGQWTKRVLTRKIFFVHDSLTLFCCSRVNGWKHSFLKTIVRVMYTSIPLNAHAPIKDGTVSIVAL